VAVAVQVTFDCAHPSRLAEFWALTLGYIVQPPPAGFASWEDWLKANKIPESDWDAFSAVVDPEGKGPRLFFQRVPEGKTVKNRVHLDVNIGGPSGTPPDERKPKVDAAVPRLVAAGARQVRTVEERGEYHVVMQDPEGNEFCLQ
jgi:Glyoxalase-like domain